MKTRRNSNLTTAFVFPYPPFGEIKYSVSAMKPRTLRRLSFCLLFFLFRDKPPNRFSGDFKYHIPIRFFNSFHICSRHSRHSYVNTFCNIVTWSVIIVYTVSSVRCWQKLIFGIYTDNVILKTHVCLRLTTHSKMF